MSTGIPIEHKFTRKQLTTIFKIAFLEAMALSIILPTTSSTGGGSTFVGNMSTFNIVTCRIVSGTSLSFGGTGLGLLKKNSGNYFVVATVQFATDVVSDQPTFQIFYRTAGNVPACNTAGNVSPFGQCSNPIIDQSFGAADGTVTISCEVTLPNNPFAEFYLVGTTALGGITVTGGEIVGLEN